MSSVGPSWAQGQLIFDNRVNNVVVAPIYGLEPAQLAPNRQGNTPAGVPSGTQTYFGELLMGPGYTAQLFGGPLHAAALNLQPIRGAVPFRSGSGAGFVVSPPATVTVPGVPEGASAKIQLRVWNNRGGTITNWGQVEMDPSVPHGVSWPFLTPPLGGPFRAPPNLVGLESFNLVTGSTLGLVLRINFQPAESPVPPGYIADSGLPFGAREQGLVYGWNFDHRGAVHGREALNSPDLRHDTYAEMQPDSIWAMELANGVYALHVAAGDPMMSNGLMRISIEDRVIVQGTITPTVRWLEGDALIELQHGRLTLSGAAAPASNRVCFIDIVRIEPVRLETPSRSMPASGFVIRFVGEPGFQYQLESSGIPGGWDPAGVATVLRGEKFQFIDHRSNVPIRFYRTRLLPVP